MANIPELKRGVLDSVVDAIGNTPIVKLNNLTKNLDAEVDVKMESFNPTGSIKDRVAVSIIEDAEKKGLLNKDSVIIEPTSGNTSIGLDVLRSEERRVGKECRSRWSPYH